MAAYPPPAPPAQAENEENSQDVSVTTERRSSRISLHGSPPSSSHRSSADLTVQGGLPAAPSRSSLNSTTTPGEATNNNPRDCLDPAHEDDQPVVQHPTREHGSIEVPHVTNAGAPSLSPSISPPLTTETEPDQPQGSSNILIPSSNKARVMRLVCVDLVDAVPTPLC